MCLVVRLIVYVFVCLCVPCADQVLTLSEDSWWEVKAQVLIVSTALLQALDPEVHPSP